MKQIKVKIVELMRAMSDKKLLTIITVFAVMMTSCDKEEMGTLPNGGAMQLSANTPSDGANTRVAVDGLTWEMNDAIKVSGDNGANYSEYQISNTTSGAMTLKDGETALISPSATTNFTAYYPANQETNIDLSGQTALAEPLLWAGKSVEANATDVSFDFKHKYVRLNFNLTAREHEALILTEATVTLKNAKTKGTFNPTTGTVSIADGSHGTITPEIVVGSVKTKATITVYVLADGATTKKTLTFTNKDGKSYDYTFNTNWIAGNKYTYDIHVGGEPSFHELNPNVANAYIISDSYAAEITIPINEYIEYFWAKYGANDTEKAYANVTAAELEAVVIWHDSPHNSSGIEGTLAIIHVSAGSTTKSNIEPLKGDFTASTTDMAMKFRIEPGTFANAVIGVKKRGTSDYLWSWHIWITDYNPYVGSGGIVAGGNTWMDRNLGSRSKAYAGSGAGSLYYQWGRKDPIPGTVSSPAVEIANTAQNIAAAVKAPAKFYTGASTSDHDWCGTNTDWDQDRAYHWRDNALYSINDAAPNKFDNRKSIFDPSPLGWMVPGSTQRSSYYSLFQFMTNSSWASYGRTHTASGLYFPALGYRDGSNGSLYDVSSNGYCWSASPDNTNRGYRLRFYSGHVYPSTTNNRSFGFPVRAVQE